MLPLFDRPVLEHTIRLLSLHGIEELIVALSHEALDLAHYFGDGRRFGVRIRYSVESEPLGTAGALRSIQEMISDTFLVVPGDAITDLDLTAAFAAHRSSSATATILTYEADDPTLYTCLALDDHDRPMKIAVKPASDQVFGRTISTGICIFAREVLSLIPPFESRDIDRDLLPRLLHNSEPVYGCRASGYWCDAGNPLSYRGAHFDALAGKLKLDLPATHIGEGIWLGERVEVHPTAEITGPVYLGTGAVIRRGAVLGERTIVGEETLIEEGARISRSIIGSSCHVGREAAITGSVIGAGYYASDGETITERTLVEHIQYAHREPEPVAAKPIPSPEAAPQALRPAIPS
jgi:mannose-1-phosphate guanylyltransferase/phosphomannomutase